MPRSNPPLVLVPMIFVTACGAHAPTPETTAQPLTAAAIGTEPLRVVDAFADDASGNCGPFEDLGPTEPMPALAGRLRIDLPRDAVSSARPVNLMSAPSGDDTETRFVIDRGASRLVVFVQETFSSPTSDLAATVAELEAARIPHGSVVRTRLASGLSAAIVEPNDVDGPPGGVFVDGAWVATADGTVATVEVYATPDVAPAPQACRRIARTLLDSIAPGDAHLDLAAGERTLAPGMTIRLPANHAIGHDVGPDFDVFRIVPVVPLATPTATLGIYLGGHPSFEPRGEERATTLFGRPASWWTSVEEQAARREALVEFPGVGYAHLFVVGHPGSLDGLTAVAETLQYARP